MEPATPVQRPSLIHKLPVNDIKKPNMVYLVVAVLVVLAGVGSGWVLAGGKVGGGAKTGAPEVKIQNNEAGISDESTFKDTATGVLQVGALNGEGTHTLIVEGGPSKSVALTSTVIDLDTYVGKKVQVWGQTLSAQKVAWLMDVGKLKVLN